MVSFVGFGDPAKPTRSIAASHRYIIAAPEGDVQTVQAVIQLNEVFERRAFKRERSLL
jgi:hypothetical protein